MLGSSEVATALALEGDPAGSFFEPCGALLFCEATLLGPPPRLSSQSVHLWLWEAGWGGRLRTSLPVFLKPLSCEPSGSGDERQISFVANILFGVILFRLTVALVKDSRVSVISEP